MRQVAALRTGKKKGDAFERLTQLYLQVDPTYRSRLRHVWLLEDVPATVHDRLRLPGPDEGIDLIAQERDGTYWAIQAKFRSDKDASLTRKNLTTFTDLAFLHCQGISFGLVTHTSVKPIRKMKLLPNIGVLGLDTWIDLPVETWRQIHAKLRGKSVSVTPRKPRPHQISAIQAARQHFRNNKATRGRLIMPCATGKSLVAYWIAQDLRSRSILVAVPSLALIHQGLRDWTREYLAKNTVPEWLCVCSDESTGKLERDEFVGEAYELGIPTTTSKSAIVRFLKRSPKAGVPRIVFTTYQSSSRLAQAAREARFTFDFAVLDEAHKTVGVKSKTSPPCCLRRGCE